ncbi:MAG: acetyl-CoA carboxylase biotin carboxylase subunit [Chloroflexota bacterium]|nr:MAG: acetyl-CoA carboxylase biotin carboxylase subunit [Chloroflexota bacterium]
MFRKILIANRGEIALRILRACRELGVRAVVAYSERDRDSLPVRLADESICIGPAAISQSYLNIPNIVSAALVTDCEAIHPGYGFLSENPYVAEICDSYGLTFIGPPPAILEEMGSKARARYLMRQAGLPVLPGSEEPVASVVEARELAAAIGYPVLVKAVNGGGGKGMRLVHNDAEMLRLYPLAQVESETAFGRSELYVEKCLTGARHIEIQILADSAGRVIHLGERECSLQRRHQKILEETPSPAVSETLRNELGQAAVSGARAIQYAGVGTFEFLVDSDARFYFIEMNMRIQVEHPITEMVTGVDIAKWQIRLASGEPLGLAQEDVRMNGHAIECRINAEDPERAFLPDIGTIREYVPCGGPGIRVESHLYPGYQLAPEYDSLLAKVIAWGGTRHEAILRMDRALDELVLNGVKTTRPFHQRLLKDAAFLNGRTNINLVESYL